MGQVLDALNKAIIYLVRASVDVVVTGYVIGIALFCLVLTTHTIIRIKKGE